MGRLIIILCDSSPRLFHPLAVHVPDEPAHHLSLNQLSQIIIVIEDKYFCDLPHVVLAVRADNGV